MSYFRKFIPGFAHFSSVLTPATSRTADRVVRLTEEMDWAFVTLKIKLCNLTDLCIPTCSDVYVMCTDASATGVGAALFAVIDGEEKPSIIFFQTAPRGTVSIQSYRTGRAGNLFIYYALCSFIVWEALYHKN